MWLTGQVHVGYRVDMWDAGLTCEVHGWHVRYFFDMWPTGISHDDNMWNTGIPHVVTCGTPVFYMFSSCEIPVTCELLVPHMSQHVGYLCFTFLSSCEIPVDHMSKYDMCLTGAARWMHECHMLWHERFCHKTEPLVLACGLQRPTCYWRMANECHMLWYEWFCHQTKPLVWVLGLQRPFI